MKRVYFLNTTLFKAISLILLISILTITECNCQQNVKPTKNVQSNGSALDFYKQYSSFTDPGEYAYLYNNLPDSLPELCSLIKSQFINYGWELEMYRDQIPEERWNETSKYPTVKSALKGLLSYDASGFVMNRKPENRLILTCRDNATMLASILKYRGIPVRVRYGFATYLIPGFHPYHVICEVWNKKDNRWMLVDPSADKIDFSRAEFEFANDVWLKMHNNEIDPELFGIPGEFTGLMPIILVLCSDQASILGNEYTIGQYPPILDYVIENNQIPSKHIKTLKKISELMKAIDAESISELREIYDNTPQIQFTKSFDPGTKIIENNTLITNSSTNKPLIEFLDIPGGTFTMGSPKDETGRVDDEVQHDVTLSAFKMSKYCVTVEQYNLFCDATGRIKPRYGPYGQANNPVTQVTWYDAQAFAEWMGCRLPTEAEYEYAARANTKTPFYTGACLTTDQANFNGEEPYSNCLKGINRKKPIPVGSFTPNSFGLYDMLGNMGEWCSDWYGEYNVNDKTNPKGPETGEQKVLRGGGFWVPAMKCRSASRVAVSPGNRGAGMSIRLVKDE
jgi:formylglycine-generating enzyme required for sulfatase activity